MALRLHNDSGRRTSHCICVRQKPAKRHSCNTNFKISASGETLVPPTATVPSSIGWAVPCPLPTYRYARTTDGALLWVFRHRHPARRTGEESLADGRIRSHSHTAVDLFPRHSVLHLQRGTAESSTRSTVKRSRFDCHAYTGRAAVETTTVLKAMTIRTAISAHVQSPTVLQSTSRQRSLSFPFRFPPLISLMPIQAFYTNYTQDWEAGPHEFFEDDKSPGLSEDCHQYPRQTECRWRRRSFA